jgi:hypothetical protein
VPGQVIASGLPVSCVLGRDVRRHRYRISIADGLGAIGREAFADFHIEANGSYTVLIGTLNQAGLHGALNRVLALGLELVELSRLPDGSA